MTQVIDYAWAQISAPWIKQQGYAGVMRYISHDPTKDLTPVERDNLRGQGLTIGLVCETTANRAAQGFLAGQNDALYANGRADVLGYPSDCTLWYAVDFDAAAAQVQSYFNGISKAGGRVFAPYGGFNIIEYVVYPGIGWQTVAWSAGKVSKRAGLLQNGFHNNYDSNTVLVPEYGQWGFPPLPPKPEEEEMVRLFTFQGGEYIGVFGHWCRHIPTQGLWDVYIRAGVQVNNTDDTAEIQPDVFSQMTKLPDAE